MTTRRTVATTLMAELHRRGVRRMFGVPGGGSSLDLIEAGAAQGIDFVLARSETAAAIMAATTAELTGAPGVVLTGLGPGAAAATNGLAHAALDRAPVVLVSDAYPPEVAARVSHQRIDHAALFAPLVKASLAPTSATCAGRAAATARCAPRRRLRARCTSTSARGPQSSRWPPATIRCRGQHLLAPGSRTPKRARCSRVRRGRCCWSGCRRGRSRRRPRARRGARRAGPRDLEGQGRHRQRPPPVRRAVQRRRGRGGLRWRSRPDRPVRPRPGRADPPALALCVRRSSMSRS